MRSTLDHIILTLPCVGWMYLIRMISWDGSPLAGLVDMINFVLDHAKAGTPHDEVPSVSEYQLASWKS